MKDILLTFSLGMESGKMRYWALGNSGSKVPVFELSEYFRVNPPWKVDKRYHNIERKINIVYNMIDY